MDHRQITERIMGCAYKCLSAAGGDLFVSDVSDSEICLKPVE